MAGQSNFQDVVQLSQNTLYHGGDQLVIGSSAGSKSLVFAQDPAQASALFVAAINPGGVISQFLQSVAGTIGLISQISAGAGTFGNGQLVMSNSNGVSFGLNASTLTASVGSGAFSNITGLGVSNVGNTAGNTGTTFGQVVFAGTGNVTLSQSTAAGSLATIQISVGAAAGSTVTAFSQWAEWNTNWTLSNASFSMQKMSLPMNLSATRGQLMMAMSGATNSSGALTIGMAIYTINVSTASLASSGSAQISWSSGTNSTVTTASSQYGGISGTRYFTLPVNFSMTPGDYLVGFWFSTSNAGTWRLFGRNGPNIVGSYEGDTDYWLDGTSVSSATSLLSSFVKTDTNYARTGIGALRQPGFILIGAG